MNCDELAKRLTDLLEGDLLPEEEEVALEHLATCENCESVLADTRVAMHLLSVHGQVQLEDSDRHRMLHAVLSEVDEEKS